VRPLGERRLHAAARPPRQQRGPQPQGRPALWGHPTPPPTPGAD